MRALLLVVVFVVASLPMTASADLIPPPSRPHWDDPPAPLPAPPEAFAAALAAIACGALVLHRRRASVSA